MSDLWQSSQCVPGYLHDFETSQIVDQGMIEICKKCHYKRLFKIKEPNRVYLSYHLRSALPRHHQRFNKEYAS